MKDTLLFIALAIIAAYIILGFIGLFKKIASPTIPDEKIKETLSSINGKGQMIADSIDIEKNKDLILQILKNNEILKKITPNTPPKIKTGEPVKN